MRLIFIKGFILEVIEKNREKSNAMYSKNVPTYFQVSQLFKCTYIYIIHIFYNPP